MQRENALTTTAGGALLVVPVLFIAVNVLEYEIGVTLPWNPFDAIYEGSDHTTLSYLFDVVIVFGPILGFLTLLASLTTVGVALDRNRFSITVNVRRGGWITLGLIGLSLLAMATLFTYVVIENLPCILRQQVQC